MIILNTLRPVGRRSADFHRFAASLAGWQTAANLKSFSKQSVTELSASWHVGNTANVPTSANPRHSWVLEQLQVGENSPSYYVGEGNLSPLSLQASGSTAPPSVLPTALAATLTTEKPLLALHLADTTGWALACPISGITSGYESFVERGADGRLEVQGFCQWLHQQHSRICHLEQVFFNTMGRYLTLHMAQVFGALWGQLEAFCEPKGITCQSVSSVVCQQHLLGRSRASHPSHSSHRPHRPHPSKHPVDWTAALHRRGFIPEHESQAQALAMLLWALETPGVRHEN